MDDCACSRQACCFLGGGLAGRAFWGLGFGLVWVFFCGGKGLGDGEGEAYTAVWDRLGDGHALRGVAWAELGGGDCSWSAGGRGGLRGCVGAEGEGEGCDEGEGVHFEECWWGLH